MSTKIPSTIQEEEQEQKQQEDIYQKMIAEVQDYAIILLDRKGIIQNWNKGAEKIKQYSVEEAVGRHFRMFYLPEDHAAGLPESLLEKAVVEGRVLHEGWRVRKDGSRFWGSTAITALHDESKRVFGFSKFTVDLTERKLNEDHLKQLAVRLKQANQELHSSEERYHKMIAEVQEYAIILLDVDGNIQNWNTGAEKIKGYTAGEIIGRNFRLFYRPQDREQGLPEKLINQAVTTGRAVHEGWRVRKDGSMFWGSVVITALHDSDGALMGFSKVTRDLTERKQAEDKLAIYLEELKIQNAQLEQFAYIASHDLQEPLRKIDTYAGAIKARLHDTTTSAGYLDKIEHAARRMTDLVNAILDYSRLTSNKSLQEECDLNLIFREVMTDYELSLAAKNANVIIGQMPVVKAVAAQIGQLFSNLLGNALKFSGEHPEIIISSQICRDDEIANAPLHVRHGSWHEVAFSDNGIGFDQQDADVIFTMFKRLHGREKYTGTGIGLALCQKIMENHGGFITAKGEKGKGATFSVYFPVEGE